MVGRRAPVCTEDCSRNPGDLSCAGAWLDPGRDHAPTRASGCATLNFLLHCLDRGANLYQRRLSQEHWQGRWHTGRHSTLGDARAQLTPYGLEVVEERLRRRSSPAARSAAARKALLIWLWHRKHDGTHFPVLDSILESDESLFEGDRLTISEVDRAAAYLDSKALIKGTKVDGREGPVRAEITPEGQDCVEHYDGDISTYER